MNKIKPNREAFKRYVRVQKSGEFNMLDSKVQWAADITKEEQMRNMSKLTGLNDKINQLIIIS